MATITLNVADYLADGASQPYAGADDVTIADTGANLATLSAIQLGDADTNNVDFLDATDDLLSLTVDKLFILNNVLLTPADLVGLVDISANIEALTAGDLSLLELLDVDKIDTSDDLLTFSQAKFDALGEVVLVSSDFITFADTQANIEALSVAQFSNYIAQGTDVFDSSTDALTFSDIKFAELTAAGVVFDGSDDITILDTTGNDALTGTGAADLLTGGNGKDTIEGAAGNDTITGDDGKDSINGGDDDDDISGGAKKDILVGGDGDDTLSGGAGKDFLTGGVGDDAFLFAELPKHTGKDLITDFEVGDDVIQLDLSFFTALAGVGVLTANEFFSGGQVHDGDDRIIYNPANGRLYYDPDGVGRIHKIRIATIGDDTHPTLSETDFIVVA